MSNIFGLEMPKVKVGSKIFDLPISDRNGRYEDFVAEYDPEYINLRDEYVRPIKGFRLACAYSWGILDNDDLETLLFIVSNQDLGLEMKFQTHPRWFRVQVTNFTRPNSDGLVYFDSATISFRGIGLYSRYPNPDEAYTFFPVNGMMMII